MLTKTAKELLDEKLMSRHARKVYNDRAKQEDRVKEERRMREAAEARAKKAEAGPSSSSPTNSPVKKASRK